MGVIQGELQLPDTATMEKEIIADGKQEIDQHWSAKTTFPLVSFINYTSDLAGKLGVKPNYVKMFFTDPCFLMRLWVTQYTVCRFYLNDEDSTMRDMSRETIMSYRRVPLMFSLDINNSFVCGFAAKLGFGRFRPMTISPPPTAEMCLAWIFLP